MTGDRTGAGAGRNPIEVLSEEFLARIRRGEAVTPQEYADLHPDLADEILALFPALLMMEELGDETSDGTSPAAPGPGPISAPRPAGSANFACSARWAAGAWGSSTRPSRSHSAGGSRSRSCPPVHSPMPSRSAVFEREARAAARLHHTNIVPIFGVGEYEGNTLLCDAVYPGTGPGRRARRAEEAARSAGNQVDLVAAARANRPGARRGRYRPVALYRPVPTRPRRSGTADQGRPGAGATEAWSAGDAPAVSSSAIHSDASILTGSSSSGLSTLAETDRRFAQGVARIGIQVAEALAHAHGQGILHRDIKPSNLLLDREGNVWITDFGLAKATGGEDLTHTGDIIGTVRYMAPERFQGAGDARADLYALGLTLYELLALRPAYNETDRASLIRQVTQEDPPQLAPAQSPRPARSGHDHPQGNRSQSGPALSVGPSTGRRPPALSRRPADPGAARCRPASGSIVGAAATPRWRRRSPRSPSCSWPQRWAQSPPRPGSAASPRRRERRQRRH